MIIKSYLNKVNLNINIIEKTSIPLFSYFLNISNINNVQLYLKQQGYLNNLIKSEIKNNLLISEWNYISGKTLNKITLNNLSQIMDKISKLHKLEIKNIDILAWDYLNNFLKFDDLTNLNWVKNFANKYQNQNNCLSHNDLHSQNIILDKNQNIHLIDWDFACLNNEYFDYASLIYENGWKYNKYVQEIIKQTQLDPKILQDFIIYNHIYWIAWNKYMYQVTKNKIFLKYIGKANKKLHYWQALVL